MATGKTFYWLKLRESFLNSKEVDYMMSVGGSNYVVLYLRLCMMAINTGGRLADNLGPDDMTILYRYDVEKIARECQWFSVDTIRNALRVFASLGLIYEDVDGVITISNYGEMVGKETDYATQKAKQRAKLKGNGQKLQLSDGKQKPKTGRKADKSVDASVDTGVDIVHTRDKEIKSIRDNIYTCDKPGVSHDSDSGSEEKKKRARNTYSEDFETWWKAYPRPIDKGNAYKAYCARLKDGYGTDELLTACQNYAASCKKNKTESQYIKHPKTFLSSACPFADYLETGSKTQETDEDWEAFLRGERDLTETD